MKLSVILFIVSLQQLLANSVAQWVRGFTTNLLIMGLNLARDLKNFKTYFSVEYHKFEISKPVKASIRIIMYYKSTLISTIVPYNLKESASLHEK